MSNDNSCATELGPDAVSVQPSSFPPGINFQFHGYEREAAEKLARDLADALVEIGRPIDISNLDGVTVAYDYDAALAGLDRGYESVHVLERTTDVAIGVAMTPSVLRDNVLKSHIVLHAGVADLILSEDQDLVRDALHTLAHECAHVETTAAWEQCFPGELLRKTFDCVLDAWRAEVYSGCWDEYAACRITGLIGKDPTQGYADIFLESLDRIDGDVSELVQNFHGGNANDLVGPVFGAYGTLMKFACYYMGALTGAGDRRSPDPRVEEALKESWFRQCFERLDITCGKLYSDFGKWSHKKGFDDIADLMEEIVQEKVMHIFRTGDGSYRIWIHHPHANA